MTAYNNHLLAEAIDPPTDYGVIAPSMWYCACGYVAESHVELKAHIADALAVTHQ